MQFPIMFRRITLAVLIFQAASGLHAQNDIQQEIVDFQKELNADYADTIKSPLPKHEIKLFTGHVFYTIDTTYHVKAHFMRTEREKPFKMSTTKGEPRDYVKYGEATFTLHGKNYKLALYQSIALSKTEKYKNYLLLPFNDLTNGSETYGGGRYIDMSIPPGDMIIIDFNKAYNPYCAYSDRYSCPIPPKENSLETEIRAGIKKPAEH